MKETEKKKESEWNKVYIMDYTLHFGIGQLFEKFTARYTNEAKNE